MKLSRHQHIALPWLIGASGGFATVMAAALDANQATPTENTPLSSTNRQRDEERRAWRLALGEKMVAASKRMETAPEYRKYIQSITR